MNNTFNPNDFETTSTPNNRQTTSPFFAPSTQQAGSVSQQEKKSFDPLPHSTYKCTIDKLELQQDKKRRYVIFTQFRITDGQHHNRCIFKRVYLTGGDNAAKTLKWASKYLTQLVNTPLIELNFSSPDALNLTLHNIREYNHNTTYWVKTEPSSNPAFTDVTIMGVV